MLQGWREESREDRRDAVRGGWSDSEGGPYTRHGGLTAHDRGPRWKNCRWSASRRCLSRLYHEHDLMYPSGPCCTDDRRKRLQDLRVKKRRHSGNPQTRFAVRFTGVADLMVRVNCRGVTAGRNTSFARFKGGVGVGDVERLGPHSFLLPKSETRRKIKQQGKNGSTVHFVQKRQLHPC